MYTFIVRLMRNWLRELILLSWIVTLTCVYLLSFGLGARISTVIGWTCIAAVTFVVAVASLLVLRILLRIVSWIKEVRTMP